MTSHPSYEFTSSIQDCIAQWDVQKKNADLEKNIAIVQRTNILY
jgi:hypothetical protein